MLLPFSGNYHRSRSLSFHVILNMIDMRHRYCQWDYDPIYPISRLANEWYIPVSFKNKKVFEEVCQVRTTCQVTYC